MTTDELKCAECDRRAVLYQEMDGGFVCGRCLSDEVIDRYPGFRQALALSLERSERMKTINAQKSINASIDQGE